MVKDRVRAENWSKLAQISARRDIARGYGAGARHHTTSVPLATQKRPIKAFIKLTTNQNYYLSINWSVLRFNSMFTRLPITNVNALTLVRPM